MEYVKYLFSTIYTAIKHTNGTIQNNEFQDGPVVMQRKKKEKQQMCRYGVM